MTSKESGQGQDATLAAVFSALASGDANISSERLAALSDLDASGRAFVAPRIKALDAPARFAFLDVLIEVGEGSALLDFSAVCFDCLADDDAAMRALAASGLADHEGREAMMALVDLTRSDPDPGVRSEAALALGSSVLRAEFGQLSDDDGTLVIESLREVASDVAEDPAVRGAALASVGVVDAAWVQDLIFDAYETGDPALRVGALQAMGRTADEYWLPTLFNAMESLDEDERAAAAIATSGIASDDAVEPLAILLEDESLDVVQAALAALGEIGGPAAIEHMQALETHPDAMTRAVVQAALQEAAFADDPLGLGSPRG